MTKNSCGKYWVSMVRLLIDMNLKFFRMQLDDFFLKLSTVWPSLTLSTSRKFLIQNPFRIELYTLESAFYPSRSWQDLAQLISRSMKTCPKSVIKIPLAVDRSQKKVVNRDVDSWKSKVFCNTLGDCRGSSSDQGISSQFALIFLDHTSWSICSQFWRPTVIAI